MPSIINSDDGVVSGTSGLKTTGGNDGVLNIQTNGTNAISISSGQRSTFPTTIGVGGATPSTSGSGITFPATQSASSNANTLDDYEEGEVTIEFADASSGGNAYGVAARYIKIGRMVFLNFSAYYTVSPTWTSGNDIFVRGLPFVTQFEGSAGAIMLRYSFSNGTAAYLWQPSGQTHFVLKQMNFDTGITGANMLSTFSAYGNVVYLTAN
jgi:hypothetical protein